MKLVTAAQMRELDRRTIEDFGTPGEELMERAGQGLAEIIRRLVEVAGFVTPLIHLVAGRGNNGGDAFTAARHFKEMGFGVEVWLTGSANQVQGDALIHLSRMKEVGIDLIEMPTIESWEEAHLQPVPADVLVDGILGTGTTGPARGPAVGAIQYINRFAADALVVAIDIPSGMNADTGAVEGDVVKADMTVTMGLPKVGLVDPVALDAVGSLEVVDIGIPGEFIEDTDTGSTGELIYLPDLKGLFSRRPRSSHKGTFGHDLLIGGARGFAGAMAMASRSAVRSGAGLVTTLVPESIAPVVAGASLETMVKGGEETPEGSLGISSWETWKNKINDFDAVLIGPGLTRHEDSRAWVENLLKTCTRPMVLDADAVTVLSGRKNLLGEARGPVVITPHPGEIAALLKMSTEDIQSDRTGIAAALAEELDITVVLKGAGTVVAGKGKKAHINMTGNPGMATGGSGDVLSGLLTGILGQGLDPFGTACASVYLHGRAGDMAAWRKSQSGLTAGDLVEEIPFAFRDLTLR